MQSDSAFNKMNLGRDAQTNNEELALLDRIVAGDRQAFGTLHERYYDRLFRFVYRITRRFDLAEEAVADVMLVVWQKAQTFQRRSTVSTWVMGIGYHKALKLAKKARRLSERFVSVDSIYVGELQPEPAEHIAREDLQDWLNVGMQQLSAEQRAVVELAYFHGYSYEEIGRILSCPINTVKTRMFHARAKLRKLLPEL
jgi:RNA polymerase sigma-70 factor (ECF subfamily)